MREGFDLCYRQASRWHSESSVTIALQSGIFIHISAKDRAPLKSHVHPRERAAVRIVAAGARGHAAFRSCPDSRKWGGNACDLNTAVGPGRLVECLVAYAGRTPASLHGEDHGQASRPKIFRVRHHLQRLRFSVGGLPLSL